MGKGRESLLSKSYLDEILDVKEVFANQGHQVWHRSALPHKSSLIGGSRHEPKPRGELCERSLVVAAPNHVYV